MSSTEHPTYLQYEWGTAILIFIEFSFQNPEFKILAAKILNSRFWKPTFIKANLRPKSFCLGLIRPKVSFYACIGHFLYFCIPEFRI